MQGCAASNVGYEFERYILPIVAAVPLMHHVTTEEYSVDQFLEVGQVALYENIDQGEAVREDDAKQLGQSLWLQIVDAHAIGSDHLDCAPAVIREALHIS